VLETVKNIFDDWNMQGDFAGVFSVTDAAGTVFEAAFGYRNRAEGLPNRPDTAFGIASGTKLFTGLAACKLIDEKKLRLEDTIGALLPYDLGTINRDITVLQLLTHTSGVGDYIDEEASDGYAAMDALYAKHPVYLWNELQYYLPMSNQLPAKFAPGARFGYSNTGYVLLGLVIEQASGRRYRAYVTESIINPCGLSHTGFYRTNALPHNAAYGYMLDEVTGEWQSNLFHIPIAGGSDGGLYTCAADLDTLWRTVFSGGLLSRNMLECFVYPHVSRGQENKAYGLGVYLQRVKEDYVYYAVGGDFGVDFFTAYFPKTGVVASVLGNTEMNTWPLLARLFAVL